VQIKHGFMNLTTKYKTNKTQQFFIKTIIQILAKN